MMRPEDVDAALVEKAARARWEALGSVFTGYNGDVARTWDALAALFPAEAERRRTNERHALAAVLPEIQAQAQQDLITDLLARDLWDVRYALNEYPIQAVPKSALLERRNRLARLTTTTEEAC